MIGSGLIRFHPDSYYKSKQSGSGFGSAWQHIKTEAPKVLGDILKESAKEGIKGLGKGKQPNWKGALAGVKRGATRAVKRKARREIARLATKRVKKDLFGL